MTLGSAVEAIIFAPDAGGVENSWKSAGGIDAGKAIGSAGAQMLGGMKAVLWTDVFQAILMFAALFAIIIKGFLLLGGIGNIFEIANEGGRLIIPRSDMEETVERGRQSFVRIPRKSTKVASCKLGMPPANGMKYFMKTVKLQVVSFAIDIINNRWLQDFDLFPKIKEPILGRRFATREDIANVVRQQITRFTHGVANAEADGIQRLPHRWQRVVTVAGDYIEGL
ncbi:uncharacterized protein TNCV_5089201 [Trichonephila clavipes]|nr:uncharacterized protein TNCV_5089201 [Trichonephila clavipes]